MPRTPTEPTTLPPHECAFDECEFDEHSAVFARASDDAPAPESSSDVIARIEAKIREVEAVIATLRPDDLRARLLRIAVIRRDEVLMTGVLRSLEARPRARTTILPPPERK
jgi:hypothetical protein